MAVVYDPSIIRSVHSLEEAHTGIQSKDFTAFLFAFENMAKHGNQNDTYGVTLVHRHAEVETGSRIFDFGQTLQPFPISDQADNLYGAKIRPKSYALRQKSWMPYEYELGDHDDEMADEFFATSQQLVQQFGLEDYIGLRRYSPDDPEELEITERKGISVKIPWDSSKDEGTQDYKTTFWAFPSGAPRNYRCSCRDTGSSTNSNHNHINAN